ncbi:MAG: ATP-binding protein, partial [Sandaracinobacteroides sp.]
HMEIRCVAEEIDASPDDAASFALLVTELVTNAAKHAYDARGGVVHVKVARDGAQRLLEIVDEGFGLPADFSIEASGKGSLGMSIIQALSQALGGTPEYFSGKGATFRVRF